jgi:uncharacterized protein YoxC
MENGDNEQQEKVETPQEPSGGAVSDAELDALLGPPRPGDEPKEEEKQEEPEATAKGEESQEEPDDADGEQSKEDEPAGHNVDKGMNKHLQKSQQTLAETRQVLDEVRELVSGISSKAEREGVTDELNQMIDDIKGNEEAYLDDATESILKESLSKFGQKLETMMQEKAEGPQEPDAQSVQAAKGWITENLKADEEMAEKVYSVASQRAVKHMAEIGGQAAMIAKYGTDGINLLAEKWMREAHAELAAKPKPKTDPPKDAPKPDAKGTDITAPGSSGKPAGAAPNNQPPPVGAQGVYEQWAEGDGVVTFD